VDRFKSGGERTADALRYLRGSDSREASGLRVSLAPLSGAKKYLTSTGTAYAFDFASTVFTHVWLSRYQRMVSRMPSSNLCAGVQPSSRWIFDASMA